ncbi:MAG: hypothetical protein N4A47_03495 [Clostridia bacterium]|nr:hypothetical protein [Clostridia bacterium]
MGKLIEICKKYFDYILLGILIILLINYNLIGSKATIMLMVMWCILETAIIVKDKSVNSLKNYFRSLIYIVISYITQSLIYVGLIYGNLNPNMLHLMLLLMIFILPACFVAYKYSKNIIKWLSITFLILGIIFGIWIGAFKSNTTKDIIEIDGEVIEMTNTIQDTKAETFWIDYGVLVNAVVLAAGYIIKRR